MIVVDVMEELVKFTVLRERQDFLWIAIPNARKAPSN
jgi:hypothetical protein